LSERTKIQSARLTLAFALGETGTNEFLARNPDLDFNRTFGISRKQFKEELLWTRHDVEANNWLDHCEEMIYRSLFMHLAYREALILHLVSHSHEWHLGLLTRNSWMVNMGTIGESESLEFATFDEMPSDGEIENFSQLEDFRELKKEIIDFLSTYWK